MIMPSAFVSQILNSAKWAAPTGGTLSFKKGDEASLTYSGTGQVYALMATNYGIKSNNDHSVRFRYLPTIPNNGDSAYCGVSALGGDQQWGVKWLNSTIKNHYHQATVGGVLRINNNVAANPTHAQLRKVGNAFTLQYSTNNKSSWTTQGNGTYTGWKNGAKFVLSIYKTSGSTTVCKVSEVQFNLY